MPQSVAKAARSMPLNSLERRPAKASIAINRPEIQPSLALDAAAVSLVFEVLAELGMPEKEAAYTMAMDPAQLSRVKSGQGRLSIEALWRLDARFWLLFLRRTAEAKGLSPQQEKSIRAARIGELVRLLCEATA